MEMEKDKKLGEDSDFSYKQMAQVVGDLFGAGSETTATSIRWAVLFLLNFLEVKCRLQREIDRIIPGERLPCLANKPYIPFVEAFVMETLRYGNVAPLAVPHGIVENDVIFEGYLIPKNTSVIFNLDSILSDPSIFEDPWRFNPDRFLDESGNLLKPKEFLPFGIGRRVCLGEAVARMELFLFLTAMIKEFDFLPPEEGVVPKIKGVVGITYSPNPYRVRVVKRVKTCK